MADTGPPGNAIPDQHVSAARQATFPFRDPPALEDSLVASIGALGVRLEREGPGGVARHRESACNFWEAQAANSEPVYP